MIDFSLNELFTVAQISKQAVHQARHRQERFEHELSQLVLAMDELREEHPGCGLEKAYYTLMPQFLGRDRFTYLFKKLGYSLKKRRLYPRTTIAGTRRFPDLIEGKAFDGPNQVWQSDITYFDVKDRFAYIVFLIDIYSKVIVGHQVSKHMRKEANLKALKGAINKFGAPQIHHSDRGSQYGSQAYIDLLAKHQVQISMAKSGPQNAYAERINLTIKDEFLNHWQIPDLIMLKRLTRKAVNYYNYKRKHNHLGRLTPIAFLKAYPALAVNDRPIVNIPILNS